MQEAEIYHTTNQLQRRDATDCLQQFANKIKWGKMDVRILDIGCGDGSVTAKILKEFIPNNFKKLLGCDISEKMVSFANAHYSDDKTSFTVLDIGGPLPENMKCSFDHVFSFYALHWVKKQEEAFRNIYDLLTESGECVLMFLGHNPLASAFRTLSQTNKWSTWLENVDIFISPYHDVKEPEKAIRKLMTNIGFIDISVEYQPKLFVYDSIATLKRVLQGLLPFHMPKDIFDEFMVDYVKELYDMNMVQGGTKSKPACIHVDYKLLVIYGSKRSS